MKKIILPMRYVGMLAVALTLLSGCRKDLCYNHDEHSLSVKVNLKADWEQEWERTYKYDWEQLWDESWGVSYEDFRPGIPEGVRAVIYRTNGSLAENNLPSGGGKLVLQEGKQDILFYNNDTEYIVFDGLQASVSASATTRGLSRGGFEELHKGERTVNQPDMLYGHYIKDYEGVKVLTPVELPVTLKPLVYTYLIRYEFSKGLKYVALARGALAGMAESVFLSDGHTDGKAATVLFDGVVKDYGAEAYVRSFGVPDFPGDDYNRAGDVRHYSLNLEVKLKNGKIVKYEFDVTGQVKGQPRGGVIVVDGIEVSDEDGTEGSGGFDPDIGDWGDWVDIPLPIG